MPGWIVTFADLVTLLMVFFILLFAMGTVQEEKWIQIKQSLKAALGKESVEDIGVREGLDVLTDKVDEQTIHAVDEVGAMVAKEMQDIVTEVEEFVYKNKMSGQVDVETDERGAVITISDTVLFPPGASSLTTAGSDVLKQVFDLLRQFDYDVKIEGHTDNTPINTPRFPSNWELSASRASEVARMLVKEGFPPEKLSVQGFAEFRPKVGNDTYKNRARNRRIEVVYQRGSVRTNMVDVLRKNSVGP